MEVREINIHLKRNLTKWQKFLRFNGIEVFSEKEKKQIEQFKNNKTKQHK